MMIIPVAVASVAALCVAALGATVTDLGPWYQALAKPYWNPPDVVFPIGWTLIYAFITVAGITAWRAAPTSAPHASLPLDSPGPGRRAALLAPAAQGRGAPSCDSIVLIP
jgi:tryptophan-rich sensory protein